MGAITPSAIIAKLVTASTAHCAAAFGPFHPEFTFRALFIFGSLDKLLELLVIFSIRVVDSILSTALTIMIVASTFQAVVFLAGWASVII